MPALVWTAGSSPAMVREGKIHGMYFSLPHRLIVNSSAGGSGKRNGYDLEEGRLPLRRRAFRRVASGRGGSPILQLLDLPHDGLPAPDRARIAISPDARGRDAEALCLQHRNGQTSVLRCLRDQIVLRPA